MYSALSCGSKCVKVSQLRSPRGEEQGRLRPNKQRGEEKTNIGNTATNRTRPALEPSRPGDLGGPP